MTKLEILPHRSIRTLGLTVLICASPGCSAINAQLTRDVRENPAIKQASFDHQCPRERIQILRHTGNWLTLEFDVCGTLRRYQYVGEGPDSAPGAIYLETTSGRPSNL